jgi:multicomponent Na+:H+ antiporter subunit A
VVLAWVLVAMLATAAVVPYVARRLGRDTGFVLAGVFVLLLGILLLHSPQVIDGGTVDYALPWIPELDVAFRLRLDGLSLLFAVLILGVGALIGAYTARYLTPGTSHGRLFGLLSLFATSMLGLVLSADVVLLFVFWEATTLSSFFLIGGRGTAGAKPATRALVTTGGGGLALLAALIMIAVTVGSTDLNVILSDPQIIRNSELSWAIGACIVLAAFTKSAQLPFHFWLPDAMVAITPVSAYLHAATMVKAGIYLLMRFSPPFAEEPAWTATLVVVGLATTVVGALFALQQHDLKALLAYSTVSQLGLLVALVGVGTPAALATAALHLFAHALFKATLFMLVGIIDREAGSRDIRELSGLRRLMPVTATLTGLAALSMAGLPPFLGFISKEEAFYSFLSLEGPGWVGWLAAGTAVCGAALTFAYGFRILAGAFGGPVVQPDLYEPRRSFLAPASVPAVLGLGLGVGVGLLNPLIDRTVQDTRLVEGSFDLALWHGFTPALGLSAITITIGFLLFLRRERIDQVLPRLRLPFTGVQAFERSYEAALAVGGRVGRPSRSPALVAHLPWPLLALAGLGLTGLALGGGGLGPAPAPLSRGGDWLVLAVLALAVLGLAVTRSQLGAVTLLGTVGFVVAGWFLLAGAPDLALTQLLVEILTVVVAVLVLRRLPGAFQAGSRLRSGGAAGLALVTGAAAGLATWSLTGRRERSPAADFLLEQSEPLVGGTNVVNTVLVDFRGLDTWGEVTVLAVAAIGLLSLLRREVAAPGSPRAAGGPADAAVNAVVLRVTRTVLVPVILVMSLYLLLRGHDSPGGGFIAALVGGAGVALDQLPRERPLVPRWLRPERLIAAGVLVAGAAGLLGYLDGAFLRPLKTELPAVGSVTSSLVFDVGVYLAVLGLVVAALDRLAVGRPRAVVAQDVAAEDPVPADDAVAGDSAAARPAGGPPGRPAGRPS